MPDEQRRLPALEVFIGFQIAGVALRHTAHFGLAYLRRQHLENLRPKLFLDREEAAQRAVEPLGPQLFSRFRVGEIDVQPQALANALDGSGHEIADRWGAGRRLAARSAAQGRSRDDREPEHLRQVGNEVRCNALSQQHRLRVIAQRLEWPDGNGRLCCTGRFGACHRCRVRRDADCGPTPNPPESGCNEQQCDTARSRYPWDAPFAFGIQGFRIRPNRGGLRRSDH